MKHTKKIVQFFSSWFIFTVTRYFWSTRKKRTTTMLFWYLGETLASSKLMQIAVVWMAVKKCKHFFLQFMRLFNLTTSLIIMIFILISNFESFFYKHETEIERYQWLSNSIIIWLAPSFVVNLWMTNSPLFK